MRVSRFLELLSYSIRGIMAKGFLSVSELTITFSTVSTVLIIVSKRFTPLSQDQINKLEKANLENIVDSENIDELLSL